MSPNPDEVYCTICGMCLDLNCIVLSGPHWPDENARKVTDQEVTRYTAEATNCYGKIHILPDRERIYPQQTTGENHDHDHVGDGAPAKMYHGIHPTCEDLANRVIKTSPNAGISGIGDLFLTLERRCANYQSTYRWTRTRPRDENYVPPILNLENTLTWDGYYVPLYCMDHWGDDWAGWWDEDPVNIPDLTTRLISNLEPAPESSSSHLQKSMEATPNEISDHIRSFMQGPLPLECTYIMPQSQWAEVFFRIPFLWDLDMETIYEKAGSSNKEDLEKWNWEKLTRQIMSSVPPMADAEDEDDENLWDHSRVGLDVPGGLTNRRRIWQVLEEMRPETELQEAHDR